MRYRSLFVSAGANRHTAAADYDASGIVAFGAGVGIALWRPEDARYVGVTALLNGHTDLVNAVKFLRLPDQNQSLLLSGSADKTIRVWQPCSQSLAGYRQAAILIQHGNAINVLAVNVKARLFVSASADSNLRVWSIAGSPSGELIINHIQSLTLSPHYFALALDLHDLPGTNSVVLAVAGSRTFVQIFVSSVEVIGFNYIVTLTGHEGWVRSLVFTYENGSQDTALLLASASQDKYIRLWRVRHAKEELTLNGVRAGPLQGNLKKPLSNKAHSFLVDDKTFDCTLEALLVGHEDWVYSARWHRSNDNLRLLTASADSSVSIWELEPQSGVWISTVRLGEANAQKGATTATGSAGGFWNCLWSPRGTEVFAVGRTGSWRVWKHVSHGDAWNQATPVTGHTRGVRSIAWSQDGEYLLSTSADQTSRLFAECRSPAQISWHELSRPQIHGYDLNCIASLSKNQFISGGDEKLFRIFDKPGSVAALLAHVTGRKYDAGSSLPEVASIPVLGLSNKAITSSEDPSQQNVQATIQHQDETVTSAIPGATPPSEDQLARHLLWPESEKLYGHGYEVCTVAASNDGTLVATACRASSLDHAVIRLYNTKSWQEVKPPLKAHTLTVTTLAFSHDDRYLLSVGRDRQCAVFERSRKDVSKYSLVTSDAKAHTRMLLSASWAPSVDDTRIFATAGRDKNVHLWSLEHDRMSRINTTKLAGSVTAIAFDRELVNSDLLLLACGLEDGIVLTVRYTKRESEIASEIQSRWLHLDSIMVPRALTPSGLITDLAWRPDRQHSTRPTDAGPVDRSRQLAIVSEDSSLRIIEILLDS